MLRSLCPAAETTGLSFVGQMTTERGAARPDIVGQDATGVKLVIEAKFDAELTLAQRGNTYLNVLTAGQPGALLYLVPKDRLAPLWPRLLAGPGGQTLLPASDPADVDVDPLVHHLGQHRVVAATSWTAFLERLRQAMDSADEVGNLGDLEQIQGLVNWRSRTGWTPLVPGDLPDRTGRQLSALLDSLLRATWNASSGKPSNAGAFGRYLYSPGGREYWAGLRLNSWSDHGGSPAWVLVRTNATQSIDAVAGVLSTPFPGTVRRPPNEVIVPLDIRYGAEQGAVEESFVEQLKNIGRALDLLSVQTVNGAGEVGAAADTGTQSDMPPGSG